MSAHTGLLPIGIGIFFLLLWGGAIAWLTVRRDERRWDLHCVSLLTGIYLAFFWRTVSGAAYRPADGGDLVSFLYPTYRFAAQTLSQGKLPLWNPHLYGGAPFIGDIQAGFLYPPNLLLFLLNPTFDYRWMQWLSVGHLWWAGLGVYVLVRTFGQSRPAALLAAVAFGLCDVLFIHLGNLNLIAVLAWSGWILAACHRMLTQGSLLWAGAAAALFATANYAGHAQSSYYLGMAVGLYTLALLGTRHWGPSSETGRPPLRGFLAALRYPLAVLVLTALLSAPILLPSIEMLPYTQRAALDAQNSASYSLPPGPALVGLFTPGFFGRGPQNYWGPWDRVELPYAGLVTLLLAAGALLLPVAEKRRHVVPWLALALFGFVAALGGYTPVHGWLTAVLPEYGSFRAPARTIVLWALALAVLAAMGLDALLGRGRKEQESLDSPHSVRFYSVIQVGGPVLLLLLVPLTLVATRVLQGGDVALQRAFMAGQAGLLALAAWLAVWLLVGLYRRKRLTGRTLSALVPVLLLVELTAAGANIDVGRKDPTRGFVHPEIDTFLRERAGADKGQPFRIDARTGIYDLWQPDRAALAGLQDVWGIHNPLTLTHWEELWENNGGRGTRIYDLLNVRFVLVRDGTPLPEQYTLAYDAPGPLAVYENPDPLARAWLVGGAQIVPDEESALAALLERSFEPSETVVLLGENGRSPVEVSAAQGMDAPVSVDAYNENEIVLAANAEKTGYLVLSEVWYPGWRATINGEDAPILRANYTLRALPVPAGELEIRMWYAPESWRWGLTLFAMGILLFAGLCLWQVFGVLQRRDRKDSSDRG